MADRFNTIAGWALGSALVALGLGSISGHMFRADKPERPEKMGYAIAGAASEGGASAAVPIETLLASADPAKGEAVFKQCQSCHTATQGGANGIGPNLYGILGDSIGQGRGGFAFSDDLKAKGGKWDFTSLNTWLTSPKAFAAGTKMTFAGLSDATDRANLMAYLNKQGSNLPLPAAPAAPAAGAAGAGAAAAAVAVVGDAKKGEQTFKQCQSCHTANGGGANGIGPNLAGIVGDGIGQGRGGFAFSDALKGKGGKWDEKSLDAWLAGPAKFAPGTKMTFAGLSDPQQRADVIAYLKGTK